MARKRMIDPKFWSDDKIIELEPLSRLCFIGLWNFSDDFGIHKNNSKVIKAEIFPADDIPLVNIDLMIENLLEFKLIELSEDEDLLRIKNWHIYQKINRPQPTKYSEVFDVPEQPKIVEVKKVEKKTKVTTKLKPYAERVEDFYNSIDEEYIKQLSAAYPNVDIKQELNRSKMWLLSNTQKAKKNFKAFITRWIDKNMENNSYSPNTGFKNGTVQDQRNLIKEEEKIKKQNTEYNDYIKEADDNAASEEEVANIMSQTAEKLRFKRKEKLNVSQNIKN